MIHRIDCIILSLTGIQLFKQPAEFLVNTSATPLWCMLSSLPEYKITSSVCVLSRPEPDHLHSLMPNMSNLYLFISLTTCAVFPTPYIVLTFHFPMRSVFLRLANDLIRVHASFRIGRAPVISPSSQLMNSSSRVRQVVVLLPR